MKKSKKQFLLLKKSEDGFSLERTNGQWYLFYNDSKDFGRVNHTIMHEIGHIILDFCFDGVEKSSIVAIGMIGCKGNKRAFLRGYYAMLEKIEPEAIICFGKPFGEMTGNIIPVDYRSSRKVVR